MGLSFFNSSSNSIEPPNPNPNNFKVLKEIIVNNKSILLVHYPGTTSFAGNKLLLLGLKWSQCSSHNNLDPHLINDAHIVIARFKPNLIGWQLAKLCAEAL